MSGRPSLAVVAGTGAGNSARALGRGGSSAEIDAPGLSPWPCTMACVTNDLLRYEADVAVFDELVHRAGGVSVTPVRRVTLTTGRAS